MANMNDTKYLDDIKIKLFEMLRELDPAPSVPIQTGAQLDTPAPLDLKPHTDDADPDVREPVTAVEGRVESKLEYYDGGKDQDQTDGQAHPADLGTAGAAGGAGGSA